MKDLDCYADMIVESIFPKEVFNMENKNQVYRRKKALKLKNKKNEVFYKTVEQDDFVRCAKVKRDDGSFYYVPFEEVVKCVRITKKTKDGKEFCTYQSLDESEIIDCFVDDNDKVVSIYQKI